jgi:hypothetical protein
MSLAASPLGAELIEHGRDVLRASQHLLAIENFHVYSQLAPAPIDERLWRLRSSGADLAEKAKRTAKESLILCRIALTSAPVESADADRAERWCSGDLGVRFKAEAGRLTTLLGDAHQPLAVETFHPYLTWRENLVFGVIDIRNSRTGRLVDEAILESLEVEGLRDALTRVGLRFQVGRLGGNLSGGQGQLVALSRALLRRTPVLVLDEPTSALDAGSRTRVTEFLRAWKVGRIVITVSHDPEFVRQADEVRLMDGGRLADAGTFQELEERSEVFRRTLRT